MRSTTVIDRRLAPVVLLLVGGCFLEPVCGVESRSVEAKALISPAGNMRIERIRIDVDQKRPDSLLMNLPITGFETAGSVAFRSAGDPGAADRFYDLVRRSGTAAEIVTDIPGRESIVVVHRAVRGYG